MFALFEHSHKREGERLKFYAALVGVDLRKTSNEPKTEAKRPIESAIQSFQSDEGFFKDPAVYQHLSKEEKQKLTDAMLAKSKSVMTRTPLGRS